MRHRSQKIKKDADSQGGKNAWAILTWDDLDRWAGSRSVSRGRAYQRQGCVRDLAIAEDGRLLATVQGGDRYIVSVSLHAKKKQDRLESHCTCPVGYNCKHAVAAVAEYLEALGDNKAVPKASQDDPRWDKFSGADAEFEDDLDEWDDDGEFDSDEDANPAIGPRKRKRPPRRTPTDWDRKIEALVRGKSQPELVELVLSLVDRFSELREEFRERIALSEGDVKRLVGQARRELREITAEPAWRNSWTGEGNTPDYSRLKHRLERLLELGHADAVLELGRELIASAMRQVNESHDEGETAREVADCVTVVFDATAKSSLPAPEKVIFAIDACLADDYDIVSDAAAKVLDKKWATADWSAVADRLAARLNAGDRQTDDDEVANFSRTYRRDRISNWLATALKNAGRQSEVRAIYEAEAVRTGSYERLVRYLIEQRQTADAERWAKEGIERSLAKLPGISGSLLRLLCEVANRRKRWDIVAAHAAMEFFDRPSRSALEELIARARKANCGEQVRKAALQFLETGTAPFEALPGKGGAQSLRVDSAWPLPLPDYLASLLLGNSRSVRRTGPHYDVLLDMAIAAKRPDDVLHWYDKMKTDQKRPLTTWGRAYFGEGTSDRVAAAVAKSHPERALGIYRRALEAHLPQTGISAYESAASYLKKMRPIMDALGHSGEWSALLAEIRERYRNRPRFMEILDKLEGRTILASRKAGRRR